MPKSRNVVITGRLHVNLKVHAVRVEKRKDIMTDVPLPVRHYKILAALCDRKGVFTGPKTLRRLVVGSATSPTLKSFIADVCRLRKTLKSVNRGATYIKTVVGRGGKKGYLFADPA